MGRDVVGEGSTVLGNETDDVIVNELVTLDSNVLALGGNDTVYARGANNEVEGGAGDDRLFGEGGNDILRGEGRTGIPDARLGTDLRGNDYLDGGDGNDSLIGGNDKDVLVGGGGDDLLIGDYMVGSPLGPTADPTPGAYFPNTDSLYGGLGNDRLFGNEGNDLLNGDAGSDLLDGGEGDDVLHGGADNDNVYGAQGNDGLYGDEGDDYVFGFSGNDQIDGGAGSDRLYGEDGNDTILGGPVDDTSIDFIDGGAGDDQIYAAAGSDVLFGGTGDDSIDGGRGGDYMDGGAGNDTYVVDDLTDRTVEVLGGGMDSVSASLSWTLTGNVENLALASGAGAINGSGNALDNVLRGNADANRLDGRAGTDAMFGDGGDDTYVVDATGDVVTEIADAGTDSVESSISYALSANLENLQLTGSANLDGIGNSQANNIVGNVGNNILDGATGADRMEGLAGDDSYIVDDVGDMIVESANQGFDTVQSSATHTLSSSVEALLLTGTANINGSGNELNNTLIGNTGNNLLDGGAGDDLLDGGTGNDTLRGGSGADSLAGGLGSDQLDGGTGADTMRGGAGADTYSVDSPQDLIEENANEGIDTVRSSTDYALTANVEQLTLIGSNPINATGNTLNNTLTGNNGQNVLSGNAGNDVLTGGGGADILLGGAGNDIFVFDVQDLTIGGTRWDAGIGTDTLRFSGGGKFLDLTSLSDERAVGLEIVDLSGSGDNKIALNVDDLAALSDTDALRVDGNAGDVATIVGSGWGAGSDVSFGQNLYHAYFNAGTALLIDTDVTVVFV